MKISSQPVDGSERSHVHVDDEVGLIRCAREGCRECFAVLFRRYCKLVWTIGWKVLRQRAEAEDLVQEVYLAILLGRSTYDAERGSVKTWIAQLAYFKALMRRRALYARKLRPLDEILDLEKDTRWARLALCDLERARLVEQSLEALNSRQRRTIELVHFEGYTLLETAAVLKESLANTRNQYYRGMKSLRTLLRFPQATDGMGGIAKRPLVGSGASEPLIHAGEI
jgi:RNA polymerase sigma-70 factor (ECF subfamily)